MKLAQKWQACAFASRVGRACSSVTDCYFGTQKKRFIFCFSNASSFLKVNGKVRPFSRKSTWQAKFFSYQKE